MNWFNANALIYPSKQPPLIAEGNKAQDLIAFKILTCLICLPLWKTSFVKHVKRILHLVVDSQVNLYRSGFRSERDASCSQYCRKLKHG